MSREDIIFQVIACIIFGLLVILFAYPFYYLLICTISNNDLVTLNRVTLYPKGIHFINYLEVFKLERIRGSALISVARTVLQTFFSVVFMSYMAYFFTKEEMWHRKLVYRFVIATMYFSAGMIPAYLTIKMLGLMNSFWVYIIPTCFGAYNMILIKTFMESIPGSLEESAEIDGAGYLTRYTRIVLPLSKPILATVALFVAVAAWNSMFDTKLYITDQKLYTLQFILWEYYNQIQSIQESMTQTGGGSELANTASTLSVRLTMTAITVIPVMMIYPFVQKYYMKGMMIGAVKG